MNFWDVLFAKRYGGSGGGGGSSDFNKAMVTVTNNHNDTPFSIAPIDPLSDEDKIIGLRFGYNGIDVADSVYESGTSVTDTYYIYQDHSIAGFAASLADAGFYTVTGDAEVLSVEGVSFPIVRIYGDCTITIS